MDAELVTREKIDLNQQMRTEFVLWHVPVPVRGSAHFYKYRVALIDQDVCVLRYNNEAGKGDHKHIGDVELPYAFTTLDALRRDFWADVKLYQEGTRP